jgi:hypothetical protein
MDTSKFISAFYHDKIGTQIDTKQLRYWESCITHNTSTLDDFKDFVLTSSEYSSALRKRFYDIYQSFVSDVSRDVMNNSYTVFWNNQLINKVEVTEAIVVHYIVNTKEFDEIYRNVVKDVVMFEYNRNATDDELNFIMKRVKDSLTVYTTEKITIDIANMHTIIEEQQANTTLLETQLAEREDITDAEYVSNDHSGGNNDVDQKVVINAVFEIGMDKLDVFEHVFKRPMYVQEFRKYIIDTVDDIEWESLLETHNFNFNKLRRIYKDFTGKVIDEYYYIKNYLYSINNDMFFESFIEKIINTKEYMTNMKKNIASKYLDYYDQELEDNDIEYIYNIIKSKQLAIVDEEIDRIMTQVKTETDNIVANIFKVYKYTLNRAPEIQEIDFYTQLYRELNHMNIDDVNRKLEEMLINNLEFHDIIKNKIKECNEHITTTKLYSLLNVVIKHIQESNNKPSVESIEILIKDISN